MWLTSFGSSQVISVVDGDTLVLVPIERLKVASIRMLQADSLEMECNYLNEKVNVLMEISNNQLRLIENKDKEIELLKQVIGKGKEKVSVYTQEINFKEKEVKKLKLQRIYIAATSGIIVILAIII